jgi:2-iminobutanoate/2-iminopropanoate deaminase
VERFAHPGFPGISTSAMTSGLLITSGLAPLRAVGGATASFGEQVGEVLDRLETNLETVGLSLSNVAHVRAYLVSAANFPEWHSCFCSTWPVDTPARTTLRCDLVPPNALFELEATAIADNSARDWSVNVLTD